MQIELEGSKNIVYSDYKNTWFIFFNGDRNIMLQVGSVYFYELEVQKKIAELGLTTKEKIKKSLLLP